MNKIIIHTLILVFAFIFSNLKGQVVADFSVDKTEGCAPHLVNFTDNSTGNNISYRKWKFGNGSYSIGNNPNPSLIYNSAGLYSITLIISDGIDTSIVTKSNYINVILPPNADILMPLNKGCIPFNLALIDNSTITSAPIVSWEWNFDDGSQIDTNQNVTHLFNFGGTYNITLKVTDSLGCSDLTTSSTPFIGFAPIANFSQSQKLVGCNAPFSVNVQNLSSGIAPLLYSWDVDNRLSHSLNLNTTINHSGNYDIFLQVEDSLGCIDSLRVPNIITVGNITTTLNVPDTLCKGVLNKFNVRTSGSSSYFWEFGDGFTSTGKNVTHSYSNSGIYDITVVNTNISGCSDTTIKTVYVDSVTANFTSSPHFSCQTPVSISYQNQSSSNVKNWLWSFGSGTGSHTSTLENPINTITKAGIFNDTLTVSSSSGCTSSFVILANDSILVTQANFTANVIEGCAPLSVNFQNTTSPIADVKSLIWDFGTGPNSKCTSFSPSFTFNNAGIYFVLLTVTSNTGCQTTSVQKISVGSPQIASFYLDTNLSCGSNRVSCFNNSSNQSLINSTYWDFGDGHFSSVFQPQHHFKDTGYLNISLTVGYNGCFTTSTVDSALYILGPILKYDYKADCDTPNKFSLTPSSLGGTNFIWDFGDGTPLDSINRDVAHFFPTNTGDFIVSFSGLDSISGCTYSNAQTIHVRDLKGDLTSSDSIVCRGIPVSFSTLASKDTFGFVEWTKDNWSSSITLGPSKSYSFNSKGTNTVSAIVYDVNKCADTVQLNLEVFKPSPKLFTSTTIGCSPLKVQFQDSSSSDTNIVSWTLDFGDGNSSNFQNSVHTYVNSRNKSYDIKLTVVDTFGCKSSIKYKNHISVNNPMAFFKTNKNTICAMDSIKFIPTSHSNNYLSWDFGDNSTCTNSKPSHLYQNEGLYYVKLSVTDNIGCTNTFTQNQGIQVNKIPKANFAADTNSKSCYPSSVTFNNQHTNINGTVWKWNFGDTSKNTFTTTGNAQHLFSNPGKYDISLCVTNSFGCKDSLTKSQYITIGGPEARLKVSAHSGCTGNQFDFNVDEINKATASLTLDFGDGIVSNLSNTTTSISHMYNYPDDYNVTMLISDVHGECMKTKHEPISVIDVAAIFDINTAIGCKPLETPITNLSTGSTHQIWTLDGIIQSYDSTTDIYLDQPGTHQLELIVWNDSLSCRDTLSQEMEVFDLPNVSASNDTTICLGATIPLFATGAEYFSWQPSTGLDDSFHSNPNTNVSENITYSITGVDSNGCENYDDVQISVIQKPVIYSFPHDTTIYDGYDHMLSVSSSPGLDFLWSSNSFLSCHSCPDPFIEPEAKDSYNLSYGDTLGCFSSDTSVTVDVTSFRVFVPNTFTPNGDGLNDTFLPATEGVDRLMYLYIYDQWGGLVFETTDLNQGWDGILNGQILKNAIFAYKFRVIGYDGKTAEYVGFVNLLN